jgi:polyisoprenoid-binding protein YceI
MRITYLLAGLLSVILPWAPAQAQQTNPFGAARSDTGRARDRASLAADSSQVSRDRPQPHTPPAELAGMDSVVYRISPNSRLEVKTGKAGLFGFAGHDHVIRARAFSGSVVYYPASSHLEITVIADSLEVLTPPDTAEIRQVTAAMRSDILKVDQHHEIRLVSRRVTPAADGFHIVGALTLVGQTREVPLDVAVQLGLDSLRASTKFSVKQTDFGIKPYSGGPAGIVKVADRVKFTIEAVALRSAQGATKTGS